MIPDFIEFILRSKTLKRDLYKAYSIIRDNTNFVLDGWKYDTIEIENSYLLSVFFFRIVSPLFKMQGNSLLVNKLILGFLFYVRPSKIKQVWVTEEVIPRYYKPQVDTSGQTSPWFPDSRSIMAP